MKTKHTPSAAAIRAVNRLLEPDAFGGPWMQVRVEHCAHIIDDATGLPELLAACRLRVRYETISGDDGRGEADMRAELGIGPRDHMGRAISDRLRAALAKAEGGAT